MTSLKQIHQALSPLGIKESSVVVHTSLRSFGSLSGGTAGLIAALQEHFVNVMMPAFSTTFITRPPSNDRPVQNGCDYDNPHLWQWNATEAYDFKKVEVDSRMGKVAIDFSQQAGVYRSRHPWHGWSVSGNQAREWTEIHPWNQTHPPLERLIEADGYVIMMGVDLRSCTAIHIAEERAGRKPLIRWARNEKGDVERIAVSGCAKGFQSLEPALHNVIQRIQVGDSVWMIAKLKKIIEISIRAIHQKTEITKCDTSCLRCRDIIAYSESISSKF